MRRVILFSFLLISSSTSAQSLYKVKPSQTDPAIRTFNKEHYAYIQPTASKRNKLFVFLPGTFGAPEHYDLLLAKAANMGYHSIGLTYPNPYPVNSYCKASADLACATDARLETFDGIDRSPFVAVDPSNSITNRLYKLLLYLQANHPADGWGQYLSNGQTRWDLVTVAGHSQGGGHAGVIGKVKQVNRVVIFACYDYAPLAKDFADWINTSGATAPANYFGFINKNDEMVKYDQQLLAWDKLGMTASAAVNVDQVTVPFNHSQQLYTEEEPGGATVSPYHGSVAVSNATPKDAHGKPLFDGVWEYLLEDGSLPKVALAVRQAGPAKANGQLKVYPNPANASITISSTDAKDGDPLQVIDLLGQVVIATQFSNEQSLDVSDLAKGVYYLRLGSGNKILTTRFLKD